MRRMDRQTHNLVLDNNHIGAPFHVFIYFMSVHVSSVIALIITRWNCINSSSGMIRLRDCLVCLPVGREFLPDRHIKQSLRLIIPDDVLIQFDLLMMSTATFETCRDMK